MWRAALRSVSQLGRKADWKEKFIFTAILKDLKRDVAALCCLDNVGEMETVLVYYNRKIQRESEKREDKNKESKGLGLRNEE